MNIGVATISVMTVRGYFFSFVSPESAKGGLSMCDRLIERIEDVNPKVGSGWPARHVGGLLESSAGLACFQRDRCRALGLHQSDDGAHILYAGKFQQGREDEFLIPG